MVVSRLASLDISANGLKQKCSLNKRVVDNSHLFQLMIHWLTCQIMRCLDGSNKTPSSSSTRSTHGLSIVKQAAGICCYFCTYSTKLRPTTQPSSRVNFAKFVLYENIDKQVNELHFSEVDIFRRYVVI